MAKDDIETRLVKAEAQLQLLAEHIRPAPPKSWWRKLLVFATVRDLLFLLGLPVAVIVAYQAFDKEFVSAQRNRDLEQKNLTLERLDKLQDINSEIYRLQTVGSGNVAFAIIEAKRGLIARLTDTVYTAWKMQPDMLGRYDLNALAEALLVQGRTDHALSAANAVDVSLFGPIEQIDQKILKARIQYAIGPAYDIEAARDQLRAGAAFIEQIERKGKQLLMLEKIFLVRLSNELWRNIECEKLKPLAESLSDINADNIAAGSYEDNFGVEQTLKNVALKCD